MRWAPLLLVAAACGRIGFESLTDGVPGPSDSSSDSVVETALAHWKFDESAGTLALDSTGNGNTLELFNGVTWTAGVTGGAVQTDGVNQYLASQHALDLSSQTAITVSLWIRYGYGSQATVRNVLELTPNYNNDDTGFGIFVDDTGDCVSADIGIGVIGNVGGSAQCIPPPSAAAWHHLVTVLDRSQPGCCETLMYIDGAVQAGTHPYSSDNTNAFGAATLYIFSRGGTLQFAAGELDDLAIYAGALTAAEIGAL
jgi:hypothetical protein